MMILLGLALIYFAWFVFWPWYDKYTAARPLKQRRRFSSAPGSIYAPVGDYKKSAVPESSSSDSSHNDDAATAMLLHLPPFTASSYDSSSHCDSSSSYDSSSCDSGSSDCSGDSGGGGCD